LLSADDRTSPPLSPSRGARDPVPFIKSTRFSAVFDSGRRLTAPVTLKPRRRAISISDRDSKQCSVHRWWSFQPVDVMVVVVERFIVERCDLPVDADSSTVGSDKYRG